MTSVAFALWTWNEHITKPIFDGWIALMPLDMDWRQLPPDGPLEFRYWDGNSWKTREFGVVIESKVDAISFEIRRSSVFTTPERYQQHLDVQESKSRFYASEQSMTMHVTWIQVPQSVMGSAFTGFPFRSFGKYGSDLGLFRGADPPDRNWSTLAGGTPVVRLSEIEERGLLLPARWWNIPEPQTQFAKQQAGSNLPGTNTPYVPDPNRLCDDGSPSRVLLGGVLANSIVWMLPLVGMHFVIGTGCRWNRRRRGLCTTCKYQLAGLTTCPECGTMKAGTPIEKGEALFPRADGDEEPPSP